MPKYLVIVTYINSENSLDTIYHQDMPIDQVIDICQFAGPAPDLVEKIALMGILVVTGETRSTTVIDQERLK